MVTPVTSLGSRSGVNWIRLCVPCTELAIALAREVLPVPGKSSSSRWPSDTMQVSASRMTCCLPSTACSTLLTSAPKARANQFACSDVTVAAPAIAVVMGFSAFLWSDVSRCCAPMPLCLDVSRGALAPAGDGDRDRLSIPGVEADGLEGRGAAAVGGRAAALRLGGGSPVDAGVTVGAGVGQRGTGREVGGRDVEEIAGD